MSNREKILLALSIGVFLAILVIGVFSAWMYYVAPCEKIKDFPIQTNVPSRCIKL